MFFSGYVGLRANVSFRTYCLDANDFFFFFFFFLQFLTLFEPALSDTNKCFLHLFQVLSLVKNNISL